MDSDVTLQQLKDTVKQFRDERDWAKFHTANQLAKAISIEAGELLECFLWQSETEIEDALKNADFVSKVQDEMADILAYTVSMANTLNIDLSAALHEKMKKNAAKYPADKVKGSARKYSEY